MGGSSNAATRQAQQAEEDRRRQVSATQRAVEGIYSTPEREAQVQGLIGSTRNFLQTDLDKQNEQTKRQLKFAMARGGTTGGSLAVDQGRAVSDSYLRGILEAERRAQAAGNSLRSADQSAKQGLFSMAQSGLDMTTAARQAGESMRVNFGNAKADSTQSGIGDVFNSFADINKRSRERAGAASAEKYQYGTAYNPSPYLSGAYGGGGYGG